jgi:hypothetical protein
MCLNSSQQLITRKGEISQGISDALFSGLNFNPNQQINKSNQKPKTPASLQKESLNRIKQHLL